MSFKTLEDRFKEKVDVLYAGATRKFDNGKPSNGRNDDPLIVRAPGKGYFGKADIALGRAIPIGSTVQDLKRLTLFTFSRNGIAFLLKQQLLQTGNTFAFTRIINPAFVLANAVPFLHIKRNLRPLGELILKTDRSDGNVKKMGQMQVESYDRLAKWKRPKFIAAHLGLDAAPGQGFGARLLGAVGNKLGQAFSPIANTATAFFAKRNIGEKLGFGTDAGWAKSRPELAENSVVQDVMLAASAYTAKYEEFLQANTKFVQYDPGNGLGDLANKKLTVAEFNTNRSFKQVAYPYNNIPNTIPGEDAIHVSFAMGAKGHVRFRAFIKDLTQNISPQYKDYQYIGRMEKFITYTGVQRDISFKLGVIAASADELQVVWTRINYLTGLVYPVGFYNGIFQPNITRLTIGQLFVDQPGYITSLATNFNELGESWDIDEQIPIAAMMDIKFTLIEKASRIAASPFYGINEKLVNPKSDFSDTISTYNLLGFDGPPKLPPPGNPTNTPVNTNIPTSTGNLLG